VVGPHPFPMMVRDFQSVVGREAREQFQEITGKLPDNLVGLLCHKPEFPSSVVQHEGLYKLSSVDP
jgi:hypothetical protein